MGRSNVGKSSLINRLLKRRNLARTSSRPGKTCTINYYAVDDSCHFVDLPGYGYAAVPEEVRKSWGPMIEEYLASSPRLAGIVALIDGRHAPTDLDRAMIGWLGERGIATLVVLTKADKVKRGRRRANENLAINSLGLADDQVVWFSSQTGEGREVVLEALANLLGSEER